MTRLRVIALLFVAQAFLPLGASASASQATVSNACVVNGSNKSVVSTLNYAGTGIADGTRMVEYEQPWSQYVRWGSKTIIIRSRGIWQSAMVTSGKVSFTIGAPPATAGSPPQSLTGGTPYQFGRYDTSKPNWIDLTDVVKVPYLTMAGVCP
jgi:hypothetical protein